MCAERHNYEPTDQIVNHRTLLDCKAGDSPHALRNLRWTLSANEREDELNATVLNWLISDATSEKRLDNLRVNEFLEYSSDSSPFEKRANHRRASTAFSA